MSALHYPHGRNPNAVQLYDTLCMEAEVCFVKRMPGVRAKSEFIVVHVIGCEHFGNPDQPVVSGCVTRGRNGLI